MRTIHLGDVIITQTAYKPESNKLYGFEPHHIFTQETIEKRGIVDLHFLLYGIPGTKVLGIGKRLVQLREGHPPARVMIDDILMDEEFSLDDIVAFDVESMQILKPGRTSVFGSLGIGGFILVYTKKGKDMNNYQYTQYHNKLVTPLGYQKPVEFYSPKYDTQPNTHTPDFRTTIHWEPNLRTNENGSASFSFYAADAKPNYWILIEGISEDGEIITTLEKIE